MLNKKFSEDECRTIHAAATHVYDHSKAIIMVIEKGFKEGTFNGDYTHIDECHICNWWKDMAKDFAAVEKILADMSQQVQK